MFGFFTKKPPTDEETALVKTVRAHMQGADDDSVRVVAAVAGLLAWVAYEDRPYLPEEEAHIREQLGRVEGLGPGGPEAISAVLRAHAPHIAQVESNEYARWLADNTTHECRLGVLDMLLDVAAADSRLSVVETNLVRRIAQTLKLSQAEYNASQERHRDKLAALRS
jgi:uncharacterized tellurite resistance protein B-like protein